MYGARGYTLYAKITNWFDQMIVVSNNCVGYLRYIFSSFSRALNKSARSCGSFPPFWKSVENRVSKGSANRIIGILARNVNQPIVTLLSNIGPFFIYSVSRSQQQKRNALWAIKQQRERMEVGGFLPFKVEYSKSARASCKQCKNKIDKERLFIL